MKLFSLYAFSTMALSGCISLAVTFYVTYLNPSQSVIIYVNNYGEGFVEAFFIVPSLIFSGIMSMLISLRMLLKGGLP